MGKTIDKKTKRYGRIALISEAFAFVLFMFMIVTKAKGEDIGEVMSEWVPYVVPVLLWVTLICRGRIWRGRENKAWDILLHERERNDKGE